MRFSITLVPFFVVVNFTFTPIFQSLFTSFPSSDSALADFLTLLGSIACIFQRRQVSMVLWVGSAIVNRMISLNTTADVVCSWVRISHCCPFR
jgi:membrane-associated phospholipid phosphatase